MQLEVQKLSYASLVENCVNLWASTLYNNTTATLRLWDTATFHSKQKLEVRS